MQRCLTILAAGVLAFGLGLAGAFDADAAGNGNGKKKTKAIELSASDPLECAGGSASVPAGSVLVGHDASQCFTYTISVPNHVLLRGAVAKETINSNFDMSPEGESEDEGGSFGSAALEDASNQTALSAGDLEDLIDGTDDDTCTDGTCDGDLGGGVLALGDLEDLIDGTDDGTCKDTICDGIINDTICDDGVCDGVDLANCTDGTCDGVRVSSGSCGPTYLSQPDSAIKNNNGAIPPKQPEMIVIDMAADGNTSCEVDVFVKTVGNPGHVTQDVNKDPLCTYPNGSTDVCDPEDPALQVVLFDVYEPAKCSPLREFTRDPDLPLLGIITTTGGLPIVDYVAINVGAKAFDGSTGDLLLLGNDFVAALPSAQLKPLGCDTDGDGEPDVTDFAPLDPAIQDPPV